MNSREKLIPRDDIAKSHLEDCSWLMISTCCLCVPTNLKVTDEQPFTSYMFTNSKHGLEVVFVNQCNRL
jgi:hypothetical protein